MATQHLYVVQGTTIRGCCNTARCAPTTPLDRRHAPPAEGGGRQDALPAGRRACRLLPSIPGRALRLAFDEPQWAVTPGQSAVLYDGEVCLGGGVIAASPRSCPPRCLISGQLDLPDAHHLITETAA
jgi:tRNA-specific 2-thiouridylase